MYARTKSERIDTTVTEVAVRRGDSGSATTVAAHYVEKQFADEKPKVLGVWMTGERDRSGNPAFAVEWESQNDDD